MLVLVLVSIRVFRGWDFFAFLVFFLNNALPRSQLSMDALFLSLFCYQQSEAVALPCFGALNLPCTCLHTSVFCSS